ncbi:deoxyribose-phosphate aldolase [Legionella jordanis]|uniref:Deoxyribose-phosphate aldolase n=1 Tax=Legionella jordanis TaxID=456 RepID=A0A0W0VB26_9GAMM|nr:deoxyribose-phosphate aldolase [Legionella jordanis]KTD17078.1 2-deoxyribose-5-phosphate aldolase [Legionella jordanis]RMX03211.1 deoxyribose-phosphate aldolase [Legionella jordanis]RMX18649.1 deoxyribose-phosphate aldolase [Legionella jordanis]VEH12725.1 2-deoxyribose-5-phosphate aldolase [Legionella jordanis]HAT8713126.1 deoxyribose-phosphate aldolase [Legionella jordanis]
MSLEAEFLTALSDFNENNWNGDALTAKAISVMDLTLLEEQASRTEIQALCEKANFSQVAAICIFPHHLSFLNATNPVKVATVINFPGGNSEIQEVFTSLDEVLNQAKIDEIDYVFPYQAYLEGHQQLALSHCLQVYKYCQQQQLTLKVILETGAWPNLESLHLVCAKLIEQGCDFLKTSTGKTGKGATPSAAFAILKAIKESNSNCGFKVSGGIRQPEQAFTYMRMAEWVIGRTLDKSWFRIGASSLLDKLI